jgi:hypothetical protein
MDLFGRTDFYRSSATGLTTVTAIVNSWDTTITVADDSVLPQASASNKGVIWINSERIEYTGTDSLNNKLLGIIRGTRGTSIGKTLKFDTAGSFVIGEKYTITTLGNTDFTLVGATGTPIIGDIFTATGTGTGTGVARRETSPYIAVGSNVYNGEETQNIALVDFRDPQDSNWLAKDGSAGYITTSLSDTSGGVNTDSIVGFIQGT